MPQTTPDTDRPRDDARTSLSPTIKAAEAIEAAAAGLDAFVTALEALRDELRRAAIEFRSLPSTTSE